MRRQHAKELEKIKKSLERFWEKIEINYYKPIRTKGPFNNNNMEYESTGDKNKNLSSEDYLDINRPFLIDMINDHKTHGKWKIQLTMQITFISSLYNEEFRIMHSKSDNVEIMMGIETDNIINELFKSFLERYHKKLVTRIKKGSNFKFKSVNLLYYSLREISLNRDGSYINSLSWIKHKRATINPKSKDNKCFRDSKTAALSHKKIKYNPERTSNLKSFLINIIGRRYSFHQTQKTGKSSNKTIKKLPLIYYLYHTILNK